jgi:hypothetical protein
LYEDRSQYPANHFTLPARKPHLQDDTPWLTSLVARLHVVSLDRPAHNYAELRQHPESHWLWTGARQSDGRAVVRMHRQVRSVPRVLMKQVRNGADTRRVVKRTCDERRCVNPWHAEMMKRGSWQSEPAEDRAESAPVGLSRLEAAALGRPYLES